MNRETFFFFDASLLPEPGPGEDAQSVRKSVLGTYASRENALFNMYPLLQYGMAPEDFDFELLLSHVDSRIGALCRTRKSLNILKDTEITIGSETVSFREGDVIRMGFTYKYTYDQITALLDINRFDILRAFLSKDGENAIFLAKKTYLKKTADKVRGFSRENRKFFKKKRNFRIGRL
ncbi:L-histidine N(alpha)-methyltransferase [Methanosarcina horonobensis]|uniref:L-histidine N(alpha)-methyltransferase n=1 Tax=Methanosarcina horonobensis TaxID=418008 RepID=UPI000A9921AE|nr:L-histidine N(alpha)-methyltransferase [Methanosarcina horonobensis]